MFLGIGMLLDVGFVMQRPFQSMILAVCAELGTLVVFPLAVWLGMPANQAAAMAMIGGADGPMVLFASLILAKDLFVPITVVGYLYLGLTYGGYPFLIKVLVPERSAAMSMPVEKSGRSPRARSWCSRSSPARPCASSSRSPRRCSCPLFVGVAVRESGLTHFYDLFSDTVLYGATFFLGLTLGVLCEAHTILNPTVLILLILGITALTFSAIGGLIGGYVLYFLSGRKYNPIIGIAAVSCVPTTAKVAQKASRRSTPRRSSCRTRWAPTSAA